MSAPNATQCPTESVLSDFGLGKLDAASTNARWRRDREERYASASVFSGPLELKPAAPQITNQR